MKHLTLLLMLFFAGTALSRVHAQSLINTNWKAYVGDPVLDTLTLHIKADSSFVTGTNGNVVVRSLCKVVRDTIWLSDYDGQYACPNMTGKYVYTVAADVLSFTLVDDPCDGRAGTLSTTKWKKTSGMMGR